MAKRFFKRFFSHRIISTVTALFLWALPFRCRVKAAGIIAPFARQKPKKAYQAGAYPQGVNFFGYLMAQMGLGQGARLMAHAIQKSGLPHSLINVWAGNPASHNETEFEPQLVKHPSYNVNIVHVNAEQTPLVRLIYPRRTWDKRYNIAVWLWELEDFPPEWHGEFSHFDEIWTPSSFNSASIQKSTALPVVTIPYGICAETDARFGRRYFNLPEDCFLFLSMYDVNSTMERKNPMGAIDAFCAAFPADFSGAGLVIKINNATPESVQKLSAYVGNRRNIFVISELLTKTQVHSLIKACDVFVSLHRSEGFGLVMAEAMYLGIPAIATNWSSNTDFMKPDNSCLVDFRFADVTDPYYRARHGKRWADPDIGHAAAYMDRLFSDSRYYRRIAEAGCQFIRSEYSVERSAQKIVSRLKSVGVISGAQY